MNSNSIRTLGKVAIVLALLSLCLTAFAQKSAPAPRERHGRTMGPGGQWWNNPRTVDALGLDDVTRDLIEEEVHQSKLQMIDLKPDVERANLELQRLLHSQDTPPAREIEDLVDAFVDAQGRVMKEEILTRARILALLTPEQRADLETMHQQRRQDVRRDLRDRKRSARPVPQADPPAPPVEPPHDNLR